MTLALCIDAGQSGVRAQLRNNETIVDEYCTHGVLTDRPLYPQLAAVVADAFAQAGQVAEEVAIGSSGLGDSPDPAELLSLLRPLGSHRVVLAHDSVTSYLGALGDEPGVVVAAGTGVVTLAVGVDRVQRVDGWGYLIGDAGSGFWIGRAGLDAVLRANDGRGPATALTEVAAREFPNIEHAYLDLQADTRRVARVASYAKPVADLAPHDPVCHQICTEAANQLALSVISGLIKVEQDARPDPAVGMLGNVFRGAVLREAFIAAIQERFPAVRVTSGTGTSLDGAYLLTQVSPDSALNKLILRA